MVERWSICETTNRSITLKTQPFRDRHLWQLFCFVEDKYSSPAHDGTEKDSTNPMLTAHRQEPHAGAASLASGTQAGGFAKVLTSIQGLQQRLDGFSFEEASQAEANVHTIIQQLLTIQAKLSQVSELKHFVSSANWMIGEIPEENFEQVDLDGLENHPQLHAIIRASKLIRVHKLMQAAKARTETLSLHDEAASLQLLDPETSSLSATQPSLAPTQPLIVSPQRTELQDVPPVVSEATEKTVPEGGWIFSADAKLEYTEPHFVEHTVINAREDKFTDEAISKTPKPTVGEMSVVVRETGFDERLLSDLIQAYGEFSPVLKSSSPTTQPRTAEIESRENQIPSSEMRSATAPETSSGPELIREDSAAPALLLPPEEQPANSNNVISSTRLAQNAKTPIGDSNSTGLALIRSDHPIVPQPQVDRAERGNQKATPNIKKHGELDRQLKNIIKDYGEYDLYPHQSSTNLKKAALAAVAALFLVLGVLYFFKAPSNGRNPAASSVTQSPDTANTLENSADAAHRP